MAGAFGFGATELFSFVSFHEYQIQVLIYNQLCYVWPAPGNEALSRAKPDAYRFI
jgi:hypothetical protein